jgi:hypothetical protein
MAINFSDKVLITNPTSFHLGQGILALGIIAVLVGLITYFTGDLLMPAAFWCAFGAPTLFIGAILRASGRTKR